MVGGQRSHADIEAEEKARRVVQQVKISLGLVWAGLKDGVCFHRCIVYFVYDPQILVKAGQCLGLNGLIFLGSILSWNYGLSPGAKWLLQVSLHGEENEAYVNLAHAFICTFFGLIWLLPVYLLSFALSCLWYQDIAKLALDVRQKKDLAAAKLQSKGKRSGQDADVMVQIAQELYRVVLFAVFMAQTFVVGHIPFLGLPANFFLLSLLNAFYSFDYKWSLSKRSLEERIHYFECHWAYFAGFGSICTMATVAWPFFTSAAVVALLYPLFILIACDADPSLAYRKVMEKRKGRGREATLVRLPIFRSATFMTSWLIKKGPAVLAIPKHLKQHRLQIALFLVAALSLAGCIGVTRQSRNLMSIVHALRI